MEQKQKRTVLLGNGINIQFGGKAYSNRFILSRIIFNARCGKYDSLFAGTLSGREIVRLFEGLRPIANAVLDGKYDKFDTDKSEVKNAIEEFKAQNAERDKFEHYYDIPLEDWFLLLRLFFLDNSDLTDMWKPSKCGLEWIVLDAIYNEGKIQRIYFKMNKNVKRFLNSYDTIFTLNYDNNIEALTKRKVYHLHGDYSVLADSENPETVQGFLNAQKEKIVMNLEYPQCYCNALLNYSGWDKYKEAQDKLRAIQKLQEIRQLYENDTEAFQALRAENADKGEIVQIIDTYITNPQLKIATDYHFTELENVSGELDIIGLSPQNDSHIFSCIDKSSVDKVIFYTYGDPPKSLPLAKEYEFADIQTLWKSLDANPPKYNCGRRYSNTDEAKKFYEIFNAISFDPITKEEMEKEANSIPDYIAIPLCKEAINLMENQEKPKNEEELYMQFQKVSRIALREGIFPSAFYLLLIDNLNKLG